MSEIKEKMKVMVLEEMMFNESVKDELNSISKQHARGMITAYEEFTLVRSEIRGAMNAKWDIWMSWGDGKHVDCGYLMADVIEEYAFRYVQKGGI